MELIKYDLEIKLPFRKVKARKLITLDFLLSGLSIGFFKDKTGLVGKFANTEKKLNEQKKEKTKELTQTQKDFIEHTLSSAVENYENIKDELLEIEKIAIFNSIIIKSSTRFSDVVNPEKNISLSCHYLAKTYGGDPWQYLEMPIDRFMFNLFCFNSGIRDETNQIKKEMAKKRGR